MLTIDDLAWLAWDESRAGEAPSCGAFEFGRVRAAFAPAGQAFAPAQTLSPLGTVLGEVGAPVATLSDQGRRLVGWHTEDTAVIPRSLIAATGASTPVPPASEVRTSPTVSLSFMQRAFRRAVAGAPLVGRVRCSRRCAVHVSFVPELFPDEPAAAVLVSLRTVLVGPGGLHRVRWFLTSQPS